MAWPGEIEEGEGAHNTSKNLPTFVLLNQPEKISKANAESSKHKSWSEIHTGGSAGEGRESMAHQPRGVGKDGIDGGVAGSQVEHVIAVLCQGQDIKKNKEKGGNKHSRGRETSMNEYSPNIRNDQKVGGEGVYPTRRGLLMGWTRVVQKGSQRASCLGSKINNPTMSK